MFAKVATTTEETDRAIEFACAQRFHRCLVLPGTSKHGPLRITFAIAGMMDDEAPTVLWIGGMFGTRYQALDVDYMANEMGVRIVYIDRPGLGGSDSVDLTERVSIWLETVPALMSHLNISHVSLVSHSAGTIFLLNTILHLPHILSIDRPYVAMAAPWVHPDQSGMTSLSLISMIPNTLLNHWNQVINVVSSKILPAAHYSGGVSSVVLSAFKSASDSAHDQRNEEDFQTVYGMPVALRREVQQYQQNFNRQEDNSGGNSEAMLCLKKLKPSTWAEAEDLPSYIPKLVQVIKGARSQNLSEMAGSNHNNVVTKHPLKIQVFFPESDMMTGRKGQEYFKQCWTQADLEGAIEFETISVKAASHDSICLPEKGMYRQVLSAVKRCHDGPALG